MTLDKILILAMIVIPLIFFAVNYGKDIRDYFVSGTEQAGKVSDELRDTADTTGVP